jgi:ribonuclease HI
MYLQVCARQPTLVQRVLMVYENALNIYAAGSSYSHPRRGGIGIRYVTVDASGNEVIQDAEFPGYHGATTDHMLLLACIEALEGASDRPDFDAADRICVFTDSSYVTSNIHRAKFEWPKSGWRNRDGRPVEYVDLWKRLIGLLRKTRKRVDFEWVQDDAKDRHVKSVQELAKRSAKCALRKPIRN